MKQAVIRLDDLSFAYPGHRVLTDASFAIYPGEYMSIIGPNGSGKSTLIKLIMGFLTPTSGRLVVHENRPGAIGYVPQRLNIDAQFPISVMELVLSGRLYKLPWYGRYSDEDKKAALEALAKVKLTDFVNRPFGTLSTGQAQRALIARALASNPHVLILDEPTASVDTESADDINRILLSLKGTITILLITHDLKKVIQDSDRVIIVQERLQVFTRDEVCAHFGFGLYHTPMLHTLH